MAGIIKIMIGLLVVLWVWIIYEIKTAPTVEEYNNKINKNGNN